MNIQTATKLGRIIAEQVRAHEGKWTEGEHLISEIMLSADDGSSKEFARLYHPAMDSYTKTYDELAPYKKY